MTTKAKTELTLKCQACGKPIADRKGYLWVDENAVAKTRQAWRDWKAARPTGFYSGGDLLDAPDRVKWQAHHEKCDPDIDALAYHIPAEQLRTYTQLLHWTAHLMEKIWIGDTNWADLLYGVESGRGLLRPTVRATTTQV